MKIGLKPPFKYFKEQREDLGLLAVNSHYANFSEMGAGKTLPSAVLSKGVCEDGICDHAIIVTPKIVLGDWYECFRDQVGCEDQVVIYHAPKKVRPFIKMRPVLIMTYQTIVADINKFAKLCSEKRVMITFDEAHYLKNHSSQRTKALSKLAALCDRVYLLTGSPITNGLKNAFPYIDILRPQQHYRSFKHFQIKHMRFAKNNRRILTAYVGTETVTDILDSFSIRHMKREMHDLPEVTFKTRRIDWDPAQKTLYKEFVETRILELEDSFLEAKNMVVRCHQIVSNPRQLDLPCDSLKFKQITEDVESIDGKIVIYAHYRHTIDTLRKQFASYNPAVIYGGTADMEGEKAKFKFDDNCRIMIANPLSAGVGTNFSISSHVIFFEYSYDLDSFDQAISRLDRPGQKNPVTVLSYALKGSIEETKILPRLMEKKAFSVEILRDPKELVRFLSITDDDGSNLNF